MPSRYSRLWRTRGLRSRDRTDLEDTAGAGVELAGAKGPRPLGLPVTGPFLHGSTRAGSGSGPASRPVRAWRRLSPTGPPSRSPGPRSRAARDARCSWRWGKGRFSPGVGGPRPALGWDPAASRDGRAGPTSAATSRRKPPLAKGPGASGEGSGAPADPGGGIGQTGPRIVDPARWARSSCWPTLAGRAALRPALRPRDGWAPVCSRWRLLLVARGDGGASNSAPGLSMAARPVCPELDRQRLGPRCELRRAARSQRPGGVAGWASTSSQRSIEGPWLGKVGPNEQGHGGARQRHSGESRPTQAVAVAGGCRRWLILRWCRGMAQGN